jgi:poly-gamma-glutamate capsule biosynthesis protein CapA/YwtB (metallophosphatase superfamily)
MLYYEWSQPFDSIGCSWINHHRFNSIIKEAKTKVDYLIAITHAGLEMVDLPLPEWRDIYREMINMGCDAIVGGHPHVPQGYEIYNGKPIFTVL